MLSRSEINQMAIDLAIRTIEDEEPHTLTAEMMKKFKLFATRAIQNASFIHASQKETSPPTSESEILPDCPPETTPSSEVVLYSAPSDPRSESIIQADSHTEYISTHTDHQAVLPEGLSSALSSVTSRMFSSSKEAVDTVKGLNRNHGYALVTKWSTRVSKTDARFSYIALACDRHGSPKPRGNNIRISRSRKIDCPVEMMVQLDKVTNTWFVRPQTGCHNHPSDDIQSHPSARLLSAESKQLVIEMSVSGCRPLEIRSLLHLRGYFVILKDIYNIRQHHKLVVLSNRSPTQTILQQLEMDRWTFHIATDQRGHLTHLFLAHPLSKARLKQYPNVILIDATYKINRYKMPVIHVTGVTATDETFDIAFCFVRSEKAIDYLWFTEHLKQLFDEVSATPLLIVTDNDQSLLNSLSKPHTFPSVKRVLCLWHIKKNVRTHVLREVKITNTMSDEEKEWIKTRRDGFIDDFWKVVTAPTEAIYNINAKALEEINTEMFPFCVQYFRDYLHPRRQYWAYHQTHATLLFGVRVTSRNEGAHARLKQYLPKSTGDLFTCVMGIKRLIENTESALETSISYHRANFPIHLHQDKIFSEKLFQHVSFHAITLFYKQVQVSRDKFTFNPRCKNLFERSMGIPCAHTIVQRLREERTWKVKVSDFHLHWYYDRTLSIDTTWTRYHDVLDPVVLRDPRQDDTYWHPQNFRKTSSKRNLTQAEIVEIEDDARASTALVPTHGRARKQPRQKPVEEYEQFVHIYQLDQYSSQQ